MTLPSRHRIRNSNAGGLRPSKLPLGHGGSLRYRVLLVDGKETFLGRNIFVSSKPPRPEERIPNFILFCYNGLLFRFNGKLFIYNGQLFRYNSLLFLYNGLVFCYKCILIRYNGPF